MKTINRLFITAIAGVSVMTVSASSASPIDIKTSDVKDVTMTRNGDFMVVDMNMSLADMKVPSNCAVLLQPVIVNDTDSLVLKGVGVYGRRRYYYYLRNYESTMLSGADEQSIRAGECPDTVKYSAMVNYQPWMDGSKVVLQQRQYGCCKMLLAETEIPLEGGYKEPFVPMEWIPEMAYIRPNGKGNKTDALEGQAYVEFPVDKTYIREEYRKNNIELAKIRSTIDSVRNDKDITITEVWLKGYASPESPYRHNRDLAIGRTAAVKEYVKNLYKFDDSIIKTAFEPEDWDGLRHYVDASNLQHRDEILALIDTDMDPDAKEARIKKLYPRDYAFLLEHCYPALRHTDYRVAYTIRRYTDVNEMKRVMKENPHKLDMNEFYLIAQTYEPGSDDFNDVFDTAVAIYPNDVIANLNAANTALTKNDLRKAEIYLAKSGDSPEAVYARGVLAFKQGDVAKARALFTDALAKGITQAAKGLEVLDYNYPETK